MLNLSPKNVKDNSQYLVYKPRFLPEPNLRVLKKTRQPKNENARVLTK